MVNDIFIGSKGACNQGLMGKMCRYSTDTPSQDPKTTIPEWFLVSENMVSPAINNDDI